MIPQEQAQQVEQITDLVVDWRGCYQQHPAAHDHLRQGAIAVGLGIAEAVGFVNNNKAAKGGGGRRMAARRHAQRFVRDDRNFVLSETIEQFAPLRDEHRWDYEGKRFAAGERDRERDVRLPESHSVGE